MGITAGTKQMFRAAAEKVAEQRINLNPNLSQKEKDLAKRQFIDGLMYGVTKREEFLLMAISNSREE